MFEGATSRTIPVSLRRQLRQEAYFGCAKCGNPILEYHHIIPWRDCKKHDVDHMVALCPSCHRVYGDLPRRHSYELKLNPINKGRGFAKGLMGTDMPQAAFMLGSCTFIRTPNIFSFYGRSIIRFRVIEGESLLSVYLPKDDFWPELKIIDNDLYVKTDDAWDFEFRPKYLKLIKKERNYFFEIDLREEVAKVAGRIRLGREDYSFSHDESKLPGVTIRNCTIADCGGGIAIGSGNDTLHWPNFAMRHPSALICNKNGTGRRL
jgi:hypothetical protein